MGKTTISNLISPKRIAYFFTLVSAFFMAMLWQKAVSAVSYSANYVGATINGNWVRVESDGSVGINLVPTQTGTLAVGMNNVTVETNSSTGYRLYVTGGSMETDGYTALYYNGEQDNVNKLTAIHATTPTAFTTANQWGYAVPGGLFSDASDYEGLVNDSTTDTITISNLKWLGMTTAYQPIATTSASNEGHPDIVPVYYGVFANNDAMKGSYYNTVVYTAFVDGGTNISMSPSFIFDGDRVTIDTEHQNSTINGIPAEQIELLLLDQGNRSKQIATCDNIEVDETRDGSYDHPLRFTCTIHQGADAELGKAYDMELHVDPEGRGIYLTYSASAVWSFAETLGDGTMQSMTPTVCAEEAEQGKTYVMTDTRDDKKYLIAKLADDRCWMVQNLAIEPGTELSSGDSNVSSAGYTVPTTTAFNNNAQGDAVVKSHIDSKIDGTDNYGGFYSWIAATAGSGSAATTAGAEAQYSICPKGWRLPLRDNELKNAVDTNGNSLWRGFPVGGYANGSWYDSGYGYWWSREANSSVSARFVAWDGSNFGANNAYRYRGYSVRCVADDTEPVEQMADGMTMQEVAEKGLCKDAEEKEYRLIDSRTNKYYTVRKMKDGNCWMVQNLWLEANTEYTAADGVTKFNTGSSVTTGWSGSVSSTTTMFYEGEHLPGTTTASSDANNYDSNSNRGSFFNWYLVTAKTGGGYGANKDATTSVCPEGWKLPTGVSGGDFDNLYTTKYSSQYSTFNADWHGSAIGRCYSNFCTDSQGTFAFWWSSSQYPSNATSSAHSMDMYTSNSSFNPTGYNYKFFGNSVRCMLDTTPTFQNFTEEQCKEIPFGETITLKDDRGTTPKSYLVSRLKMSAEDTEGTCWMVQNLAIDPGTPLTSSDSNVSSSGYTVPTTTAFNNNAQGDAAVKSHQDGQVDSATNYGGFYTWIAATAGSGSSATTAGAEAQYSICPKGWRLPLRDNELKKVVDTNGNSLWRGFTAGYYRSGSWHSGDGYWWSREANDSTSARSVYWNGSSFSTYNDGRYLGFSVRCVFVGENN